MVHPTIAKHMIPVQVHDVTSPSRYDEYAPARPSSWKLLKSVLVKSLDPYALIQCMMASPNQKPPVSFGELTPHRATMNAIKEKRITSNIHPERMAGRFSVCMVVSAQPETSAFIPLFRAVVTCASSCKGADRLVNPMSNPATQKMINQTLLGVIGFFTAICNPCPMRNSRNPSTSHPNTYGWVNG